MIDFLLVQRFLLILISLCGVILLFLQRRSLQRLQELGEDLLQSLDEERSEEPVVELKEKHQELRNELRDLLNNLDEGKHQAIDLQDIEGIRKLCLQLNKGRGLAS